MKALVLALIIYVFCSPAIAMSTSTDMVDALAPVIAEKRERVQKNITLNGSTNEVFWKTYDDFEVEVRGLLREHVELVQVFIESDKKSDDEVEALIDKIVSVQQETIEVQSRFLKEVRMILPHDQVVNLITILTVP